MRSLLLVLLLPLVASCWSSEPPHSAYYVVSFGATDAILEPAARAVIDRAVRDVKGNKPRVVALMGYVGADGSGQDLCNQRLQVVEEELISGGVVASLLQLKPTTTDKATFDRLGNGVVVQIERGAIPAEKAPEAD
jgi:hypothetical protein